MEEIVQETTIIIEFILKDGKKKTLLNDLEQDSFLGWEEISSTSRNATP